MLNLIAAGAMAASSLTGPLTVQLAPPPTDDMVIAIVGANGSGCPKGSAEVTVSPDNKAFTVSYSKFIAQVGPEAKPTDFRKNCQLALDVLVPNGYTYAVAGADYRGYASLQQGVTASETAFYYFTGMPQTMKIKHDFVGYHEDEWQRTDKVELESMAFAPCGERRYLNVNTELKVNGANADKKVTNWITMDSTDGNLETIYHVAWTKCED